MLFVKRYNYLYILISSLNPMYSKKYKNHILVLLVAFFFMDVLDMSVVNVAIPKIMSSLDVNLEYVDWVVIAYNIANAIIIIPMTFIIKKIGIKIPMLLSIIFFTISSIACGFATSIDILIFFRILQGLSGGGIIPLGLSLLGKIFEPHERGKAMGIWGIGAMVAPAIGPIFGGWITDRLTWRWIFFTNAPIGLMVIIGILIILENDISEHYFKANFDLIGFFFFSVAVAFFLIASNEGHNKGWNSSYIHVCEILSAGAIIIFLLVELFVKHPLINFDIFKNYNFTVVTFVNIIRAIVLFGYLFILPVYLETIMDYTPYMTGLIMMPAAIAVALSAPLFGIGSDRYGPKYFIIFGMLLMGIFFIMYGNLSLQSNVWDIIYPSILGGIGFGMLYAPFMSIGLNSVKKEQVIEASGLLPVVMRLSAGFGVAFFTNYITTRRAYYLTSYGDKINDKNYIFLKTQSYFNSVGLFKSNTGILANSHRINPGLGIIYDIVKTFATVQSYDDAFLLAAVICFIGIIPATIMFP